MRFSGSTYGPPITYDLLPTRPCLCGYVGKTRRDIIRQLDGHCGTTMTTDRVKARRHLRTPSRRARVVRREKARAFHCRLVERVARLLSWGQVQDNRAG